MRTFVYVDGFNLYYGALRGTPWKWLDFPKLFAKILQSQHRILKVKYFTAKVSGPASRRQEVYLRALRQYRPEEVEIHLGHFKFRRKSMPLANPTAEQKKAEVIQTEEKGSDVNLAVHLLNDSWLDAYDCAVVVSNDSDIAEALRLVKKHHEKQIGLVTPGKSTPRSGQLVENADFLRRVQPNILRRSQLPNPIPGTNIKKPSSW